MNNTNYSAISQKYSKSSADRFYLQVNRVSKLKYLGGTAFYKLEKQ